MPIRALNPELKTIDRFFWRREKAEEEAILTDVIAAGQTVVILCIYVQHQSLIIGRRVHVVVGVQLEVRHVVVVVLIVVGIQIVSITADTVRRERAFSSEFRSSTAKKLAVA